MFSPKISEGRLILLHKVPRCAVELNKAADIGDCDGSDQGRNANRQHGVVSSLTLGVDLK